MISKKIIFTLITLVTVIFISAASYAADPAVKVNGASAIHEIFPQPDQLITPQLGRKISATVVISIFA